MIYWYMNLYRKLKIARTRLSSNKECQSHSKKAYVFDSRCKRIQFNCCKGYLISTKHQLTEIQISSELLGLNSLENNRCFLQGSEICPLRLNSWIKSNNECTTCTIHQSKIYFYFSTLNDNILKVIKMLSRYVQSRKKF